ncbi:baseplate J/gp47 family protein [Neisseria meningitidis]|nr:hypothetical protein NMBG2136_1040 [Neisseria meningitidis G2136]EGC60561.1 hypothetical protein NMBES14902_1175 [Neisseria meningitidis ES14902]EGC64731.1 hypothetical protein NMB9615945_1071 [Neisseria meningitidis 961-5945]KID53711.1 hypothetical protein N872_04695 [Neisseria meningitidis LNP27256]MBG8856036.1 hypothetical protein [Neisseria meningitidis]
MHFKCESAGLQVRIGQRFYRTTARAVIGSGGTAEIPAIADEPGAAANVATARRN